MEEPLLLRWVVLEGLFKEVISELGPKKWEYAGCQGGSVGRASGP